MLSAVFTPLLFILLFFSSISWAVDCANDESGSKGASANMAIMQAINAARDPLTQAFQRANPTQGTTCPTCGASSALAPPKGAQDVQKIGEALTPQPKIRKECIVAALNRGNGSEASDAYSCSTGSPKKVNKDQCITERGVRYIEFALNQAMSCLSTPDNYVDPRTVLKKINNESGFNFFMAGKGGVGIGQLISDPPKDLAGFTRGGKFQEGNARHLLEELVNSKNSACAPFKDLIQRDLKNPPAHEGNPANYCNWVSPGDGLARNIIYSIAYFQHIRQAYTKPAMLKHAPTLAASRELLDYFSLVAYNKGPKYAEAMMRTLRINDSSSPDDVKRRIAKHNDYVGAIEVKMDELLENAYAGRAKYTKSEKRGDTCVSQ